jgi:hypothetical protein
LSEAYAKPIERIYSDLQRIQKYIGIIRKMGNGNRSKNGTRILEILLSIIETLKLQGKTSFKLQMSEQLRKIKSNFFL